MARPPCTAEFYQSDRFAGSAPGHDRWVYDFQHFTGAEFFQQKFPHDLLGLGPLAQ